MPGKTRLLIIKMSGINIFQVEMDAVSCGCKGRLPVAALCPDAADSLARLEIVKVKLLLLLPVQVVHIIIIKPAMSRVNLHSLGAAVQASK